MGLSIVTFGPQGTYTDTVARLQYPEVSISYLPTNNEIIAAVERGEYDVGVIPQENKLEGRVKDVYKALLEHNVIAVGKSRLQITHAVAVYDCNVRPEDVTEIRTKDQAYGQASVWVSRNLPNAHPNPKSYAKSTVAGMHEIAEGRMRNVAAIGPKEAAVRYGLHILTEEANNDPDNETLFHTIAPAGAQIEKSEGKYETWLLMRPTKDYPHLLQELYTPITSRGINMTFIESVLPHKLKNISMPSGYLFEIKMEGHYRDMNIAQALEELAGICIQNDTQLRMLGSYLPIGFS